MCEGGCWITGEDLLLTSKPDRDEQQCHCQKRNSPLDEQRRATEQPGQTAAASRLLVVLQGESELRRAVRGGGGCWVHG